MTIPETPKTEVFINVKNQIVIHQVDECQVIFFSKECAQTIIKKIKDCVRELKTYDE